VKCDFSDWTVHVGHFDVACSSVEEMVQILSWLISFSVLNIFLAMRYCQTGSSLCLMYMTASGSFPVIFIVIAPKERRVA
jgi:hypothetical protein